MKNITQYISEHMFSGKKISKQEQQKEFKFDDLKTWVIVLRTYKIVSSHYNSYSESENIYILDTSDNIKDLGETDISLDGTLSKHNEDRYIKKFETKTGLTYSHKNGDLYMDIELFSKGDLNNTKPEKFINIM